MIILERGLAMSWLPKNRVVVPVDFSYQSIEAAATALSLVNKPSSLYVIHVLPVLTDFEAGVLFYGAEDGVRMESAEKTLRDRLSAAKFNGFQLKIAIGEPGYVIADFAEQI